jgi:hypothetical protein
MSRIGLGILQNAWSPVHAGGNWNRESWLRALAESPTGRRLKILEELTPSVSWWWDNTTPLVGASAASVIPADPAHVRRLLKDLVPEVVVTFGKQAERVVREVGWDGPWFVLPHPAYRVVTDSLFAVTAGVIEAGTRSGRTEIRQGKGSVQIIHART